VNNRRSKGEREDERQLGEGLLRKRGRGQAGRTGQQGELI